MHRALSGYIVFMPPRPQPAGVFIPLWPRPAGAIERSGCPYVRNSVDQVNIFIQGRISRPINGSKLRFHIRMYLYETSRNMQEL